MLGQTERTSIRHIELSDADFILRLVHSPGWIKYIGKRDLADVSAAETYIQEGFCDVRAENGFTYYLISDLQGVKLGVAGFLKKDFLDNPDFGFAFLPQFHGKGLAFESCHKILNYGLSEFSFSRLDAVTMHSNKSSVALLEKLGFVYIDDIYEPEKKECLRLYRLNAAKTLK